MEEVKEYKLKIIKLIDETPDTKTFRVERKGQIGFKPGQFFMVRFEDNSNLHRAYSIASSPTDKNHMDITMNLVGTFTEKLWSAKAGDYLMFKGPYGKFYFDESIKEDLILIGGGLGITPFRSILRYCANFKLENKIKLIYSVKAPKDIVYKDELEKLKEENPNYALVLTMTRPTPDWKGRIGRINEMLLKENISNMENSLFYLCGSLDFVRDMAKMLESLGAKKEKIRKDIWGNY